METHFSASRFDDSNLLLTPPESMRFIKSRRRARRYVAASFGSMFGCGAGESDFRRLAAKADQQTTNETILTSLRGC